MQRMERIRRPEVAPLAIWDLWVDGATLWEWSYEPDYPVALRQAVEILWAGGGHTQSHGPVPDSVAGFEAVFLAGGGALPDEMSIELANLPFAVVFCERPVFGSESGGFGALRARGLSGWVADLGQSQLKLVAPKRRWTFPRDWVRLPGAGRVSPAAVPAQRRRLREFIALKLQMAMAETAQCPQSMVFALPGDVAEDGTPEGSSYSGMKGDQMLLPDALKLAGLAGIPLFVLNDAELAAFSALSDARLTGFRKILVLTLGFGIGAALIHRAG
jgi:hypothetical protein